ncbi:MAG: DUF559 domain-containing protein [Actinobacteria bacterium]|nr:DUF559 domain-containing protein [Actinomycetota bacterium]
MAYKRNSPTGAWAGAAYLAKAQLGLVSRQQLRDLGIPDGSIAEAVARGRLHVVFRSVFALGHGYLTPHARLLAATMACGLGTVVSHGTAAWLLDLREWRPRQVDVIAPIESGRKIRGIKRRFVPPPTGKEVTIEARVPATSPSRTIVDNAGILGFEALGEMIEQAAVLGVLNTGNIDRILDGPPRRGARKLLRLLEPWRRYKPGIRLRSRLEAKLLPLLTRHGLPVPETNQILWLGGKKFEVDFLWRHQWLVVEADGGNVHNNPAAGRRDSRRNRALVDAGYRILRLGWEDLRDRPDAALAELAALISTRP